MRVRRAVSGDARAITEGFARVVEEGVLGTEPPVDVDARAELEAKGVEFAGETFDTGVCLMALFTDPDGNDLMLHHRYAPRH